MICNQNLQARLRVSEVVLQQIISLNRLDVELYKHAKEIFAQERKHLTEKSVKAVSPLPPKNYIRS